jgi:hypothetical protein
MKAYDLVLALKVCDPLARPGLGKVTYQQVKVAYRTHRQVASESTFVRRFLKSAIYFFNVHESVHSNNILI